MMNEISQPTDAARAWGIMRQLTLVSSILIYLLIVLGGVVSATRSGGSCPDWPTCLGSWGPPGETSAGIDYAHRLSALLPLPTLLGASALAWAHFRRNKLLSWSLYTALGLIVIQIALGAWIALVRDPQERGWLSVAHMALSLLALAGALLSTIVSFYPGRTHLAYRSPFARLTLALLVVSFTLMLNGALVKGAGAAAACSYWPLCGGSLIPNNITDWLNLSHRALVALAGLLTGTTLIQAWRTQRTQTPVIVAATATAVLFFAQALLGARLVQGFPVHLLWLHQATAVAVWGALVVQFVAVGAAARTTLEEHAEAQSSFQRRGLARDMLMLTKPIVVALLLVTTFAGMVIGAQAWPSLSLTFWTLLGGFLAAGGSGAINQYIDRFDDQKMQRTQKRPIPSGRLTPGEGLAFGVGIALASFYLTVAFVNFLAALLTLAGILYYVLLYSIFLKKTTVQNIVIGGGAGAIPPLVGWAAATGGLNIPSLFLFGVIFMWTPPHFWALALVRRKDYARAGVPMLPVVRGEKETRWQIFLYTLELVGLTLLLPIFGLGGAIYLLGAAMLGGWLTLAAWRVWKQGGNKLAWRMYRYSSMYLAFLFIVLMVDRLV